MPSNSEQPNTDQVNLAEGGNTAPCGDKAGALRGGAWQPIATAPKDGTLIELGAMEDGEITQTAVMQWGHIQRNGLFPGACGMWVCPGGNFTWNPDPAEFGPSHWRTPT